MDRSPDSGGNRLSVGCRLPKAVIILTQFPINGQLRLEDLVRIGWLAPMTSSDWAGERVIQN